MSNGATTITPELIAELRERYTPPTIPPCRVCGGTLSIAQVGGGQPTEWACSGKEDDPERPGWLRDAPGRWSNAPDGGSSEFRSDGHYSRSRWTDYRSGGDSGVIAVLDALESKVQQPAAVDEVLAAVRAEVARATAKFPTWPTDPLHASGVVQEESGELAKAVLQAVYEPHKSTPEDAATEAFQTAAMAVRFLMSIDKYHWQRGEQHEQSALAAQQGGKA